MNFTIQDIETIQKNYDFIEAIKRLKRIGVLACDYNLLTGIFNYYGDNQYHITVSSKNLNIEAPEESNPDQVKNTVDKLQEGGFTFESFCRELARAGVYTWEVNLELLHIEYKNQDGQILMRKQIPSFAD